MNKLLKYTHPAITNYDVNKNYLLEELKKDLSFEKIKLLFTPVNFNWDEENKLKKNKKVVIEKVDE